MHSGRKWVGVINALEEVVEAIEKARYSDRFSPIHQKQLLLLTERLYDELSSVELETVTDQELASVAREIELVEFEERQETQTVPATPNSALAEVATEVVEKAPQTETIKAEEPIAPTVEESKPHVEAILVSEKVVEATVPSVEPTQSAAPIEVKQAPAKAESPTAVPLPTPEPSPEASLSVETLRRSLERYRSEKLPEVRTGGARMTVQDLSQLNLNDRIAFSKRLFGGSIPELLMSLGQLNQATSFQEALVLMSSSFSKEFHWKESDTLGEFLYWVSLKHGE